VRLNVLSRNSSNSSLRFEYRLDDDAADCLDAAIDGATLLRLDDLAVPGGPGTALLLDDDGSIALLVHAGVSEGCVRLSFVEMTLER